MTASIPRTIARATSHPASRTQATEALIPFGMIAIPAARVPEGVKSLMSDMQKNADAAGWMQRPEYTSETLGVFPAHSLAGKKALFVDAGPLDFGGVKAQFGDRAKALGFEIRQTVNRDDSIYLGAIAGG